jgi:hypothetical protein
MDSIIISMLLISIRRCAYFSTRIVKEIIVNIEAIYSLKILLNLKSLSSEGLELNRVLFTSDKTIEYIKLDDSAT